MVVAAASMREYVAEASVDVPAVWADVAFVRDGFAYLLPAQ